MKAVVSLLLLFVASPAYAQQALTLRDALTLARTHRSEAGQALLAIEAARLDVLRAWLERVQLSVTATGGESGQKTFNLPTALCTPPQTDACRLEQRSFSASATLTAPLWTGLKIEADLGRAHALERAAAADRRTTLRTIDLDVVGAYWAVRRAELLTELTERVLVRDREIERLTKSRAQAGIAPIIDYDRAHIQVMQEELQLGVARQQVDTGRAQLALALQIEQPVRLVDDPTATAVSLPPLAEAEATALAHRPELTAARERVEAQRQAVRAAKGAYWPQLSFQAQATAQDQPFYLFDSTSQQIVRDERLTVAVSAGIIANWNAFDGLSTWIGVRSAELERQRLEADRARQRHEVLSDVRTAHATLAGALARMRVAEESVHAATETLDLLKKRYDVGSAMLFELLLADTQLIQLESNLVDLHVTAAESDAELRAAEGVL